MIVVTSGYHVRGWRVSDLARVAAHGISWKGRQGEVEDGTHRLGHVRLYGKQLKSSTSALFTIIDIFAIRIALAAVDGLPLYHTLSGSISSSAQPSGGFAPVLFTPRTLFSFTLPQVLYGEGVTAYFLTTPVICHIHVAPVSAP